MKNSLQRLFNFFRGKRDLNSIEPKITENLKNGSQRVKNLYNPSETKTFKISRSKLELFMRCKRCFYIDRRLGVGHPDGYPFSLNIAVDELLKKEFDIYRSEQKPHPLCIQNNINAIPFQHEKMDDWRQSLHAGIQYIVPHTNIMLHGGVDDIWIDQDTQELIIVEYKATSKNGAVDINADWQIGYKRQAEIYQWLLRKNGFKVSNTAYFVYCNGKKDAERFDKQLNFDISLLPYHGDDSWVDAAVMESYACLQADIIPPSNQSCNYCQYHESVNKRLG